MQDLFSGYSNEDLEGDIENGKTFLESLCDTNNLKPKVWAQHKKKKKFFGVSLGVRSVVRPLYLYFKLCELRNSEDKYNTVKLDEVQAYEFERRKKGEATGEGTHSDYNKEKSPCISCRIFFDEFVPEKRTWRRLKKRGISPFANCAEYDVIRNDKLNDLFSHAALRHWKKFEEACIEQFNAFMELKTTLQSSEHSTENVHFVKKYCYRKASAKIDFEQGAYI